MATQICPACKEDAFTWSMDEEKPSLTYWGCHKCSYGAYEDESLERECSECTKKTESKLEDDDKIYWWCSNCNKTQLIKEINTGS